MMARPNWPVWPMASQSIAFRYSPVVWYPRFLCVKARWLDMAWLAAGLQRYLQAIRVRLAANPGWPMRKTRRLPEWQAKPADSTASDACSSWFAYLESVIPRMMPWQCLGSGALPYKARLPGPEPLHGLRYSGRWPCVGTEKE